MKGLSTQLASIDLRIDDVAMIGVFLKELCQKIGDTGNDLMDRFDALDALKTTYLAKVTKLASASLTIQEHDSFIVKAT